MADKPIGDKGWLEPESPANDETQPVYPYNNVTLTESGHSFEMDDTPERERIRLQHRTGTFIEMHPNGDEVHKVYGDGYEITIKNKNVLIEGDCNITVNGDAIMDVKGNKIERVAGDYTVYVQGEYSLYSEKDATIVSDEDVVFNAGSALGLGSVKITAGDQLYVSGDVAVGGSLSADLITSKTRVDAGTGVNAGPLGFVSVLGGLSIGVPVASPGNIICVGLVNAGVSVNSPLGSFAVMKAGLMTDTTNKTIYNVHFHKSPKGPTSPPLVKMV
jgi:hypothetical protein